MKAKTQLYNKCNRQYFILINQICMQLVPKSEEPTINQAKRISSPFKQNSSRPHQN